MKKAVEFDTYMEIGTEGEGSVSVPVLTVGIGTRIADLSDVIGSRAKTARAMGVSVAALQRYLREENMLPFDAAAKLCASAGARMEWLATGYGPKYTETKEAGEDASQAVRPETLTIAIQLAAEALQGKYLPPPKYAELVALIYEFLEDGLPEAKILRFARAAGPGE